MTLPAPTVFSLASHSRFESRAHLSDNEPTTVKLNQFGINMVDLMMWLVIAALLLAAALQGIGFYQKAAWNYQLKSDAAAVRTYMEAQYTLNGNKYPTLGSAPADLKLTSDGGVTNTVIAQPTPTGGWTATVCSKALEKALGTQTGAGLIVTSTDPGGVPTKGDCF